MLKKTTQRQKVLLALEMANAAGRQQLIGVFRFLGSIMRWNIRIVQPPTELTEECVKQCAQDGFNGIITALPCSKTTVKKLAKSKIPVVLLDIDYPDLPKRQSCIVQVDDKDIARQAANYFLKLGSFNDFGYLANSENSSWSIRREQGFGAALARNGQPLNVFREPFSNSTFKKDLRRWLQALHKPAAVFCANDTCAGHVLSACREEDIKVPNQMSILGVDDDEYLCELSDPPLSSVRPDFENEGFWAAMELSRLMSRRTGSKARNITGAEITERDSTRQLAPGGALVKRAIEFIRRNAKRNITVSSVVTYLGVSRRLADLRFRQFENKTILEAITHHRLESVKRLLRESGASISTISRSCGFSSEGYLKELFHRKCGLSMREYRAQNR